MSRMPVHDREHDEQVETIKVGPFVVERKLRTGEESMFVNLVAGELDKKYKEFREQNPDTSQALVLTALDAALHRVKTEDQLRRRVSALGHRVDAIAERLDSLLPAG
jgi:uncharacterized protein YceH (UPF0502 family)